MKLLFLGYAVNQNGAERYSGVSIAGNNMQINVLKGIKKHLNEEIHSITVSPVAVFPKEKKIWIRKKEIDLGYGIKSIQVPFLNIPVFKQLFQVISVYLIAKKIISSDTIILTFNLYPQIGIPAIWLKRKYGLKVCSLLADLPINSKNEANRISAQLARVFNKSTEKSIRSCDHFIALNKKAIDKYAPGKDYIIMEGGVDLDAIPSFPQFSVRNRKIVYSGALTEYSGIMTLIRAIRTISDSRVTLEIYGKGYLENEITSISREDSRIHFYGFVSNDEIRSIQNNAFLLVNPRPSTDEIAQVTFPSKILEYMSSGTPVLSTKLNGLSSEYLDNLFIVEDETVEGFSNKIKEILNMDENTLEIMAKKAFEFITTKKNWDVQNERIIEYLKTI